MLRSLHINNVVLIDKLDLEFAEGFGVLTGETGAGKSILLDSLGLVLGRRAETSLIRQGCDKMSVTAVFENINNPELSQLLEEHDLESSKEIIIKRTLNSAGVGKIFFNDQIISAKLLKEIGKFLVEIHGQFDNQGLLNQANHRSILDAFGNYTSEIDKCKKSFMEYQEAYTKRTDYENIILKAKEDEENLTHWIKELEQISPKNGEITELQNRRQELMQSEKIIENFNYAYAALQSGKDITSAIRTAEHGIAKVNALTNDKYGYIYTSLDNALIEIEEAIRSIEEASSDITHNTDEQANIDSRIFALKDLSRKHNCEVDSLNDILQDFKQKLNAITYGEEELSKLRAEEQSKRLAYIESAASLHQKRVETAKKLDNLVMAELPALKMDKAKFVTIIKSLDEKNWSDTGFDEVSFTVATNPNSPQGAITKIASGGELARFMLALKVNLVTNSTIGTMIFDEIDAGVGGAVSQAVGDRLLRLGHKVQVLVVTHAPQVAALGDYHLKVEKNTIDDITSTKVYVLDSAKRKEEIARMLSGEITTDEARAAALQLMKNKD